MEIWPFEILALVGVIAIAIVLKVWVFPRLGIMT
jgi:hypothetical protein